MASRAEHKRRESVHELPEDERPENDGYEVAKRGLADIVSQDADDEALNKYKRSLLGAAAEGKIADDPNDPRHVIFTRVQILPNDRPPIELDPNNPNLASTTYTLKEGCSFRIKVFFRVQRDIVLGLKFLNLIYRHHIRVDKNEEMLGSYAPGQEYEFTFAEDVAPSGMLARGHYTAKARFIDDDKRIHLEFEYGFDIKKEWDQE